MVFGKKREKLRLDPENIPAHIAVIMDGNGRWAQKRGLPRTAGHSAGSEAFQRAAEHLSDLGVNYFTVYAFSTENWKRPQEEVGAIMGLLDRYLHKAIREMAQKNIRLRFFGDLSPLSDSLKTLIAETDSISASTSGMQVNGYSRGAGVRTAGFRGHPRPGPDDPSRRRAAPVQLFAVAERLFGVLFYRHPVA